MNAGVNYKLFYEILLNLREVFHGYGRIDDSNAKLDEIVKLIMLSYYEAIGGNRFSLALVKEKAKSLYDDETMVAPALRKMFEEAAECSMYRNVDGTSIFGANASLNIQTSENNFAERLVAEIEKIDFVNLIENRISSEFDIINECFGHFVRENFRNNKEDAQYMTPSEITEPVLKMMFSDMEKDVFLSRETMSDFKIMDPTCGVGTLLIESSRMFIDKIASCDFSQIEKENITHDFVTTGMLGQDKVDRMVRLSKINTLLMGGNISNIFIGNSISEISKIDSYQGKIDLIFTNPPFGAEYNINEINADHFALINDLEIKGQTISSELLLLLKCISLLKPNGRLAIVLPDSSFSAKGINAEIRKHIIKNYQINAVLELPAVTFAQAGTRTKTSILYLINKRPEKNHKIMMGICGDIGFNVKERMGVPVKVATKCNELELIAQVYIERNVASLDTIISENPSVTMVGVEELIDGIWNPSFYNAARLNTLNRLANTNISGYELRALSDIVKFETIGRKNCNVDDNIKHISVLHINSDSTIDFQEVLKFNPISKGRRCYEGDILFSKINPRIPRITVIPSFEKELVCSNEFEILQPCADVDAYAICFFLKSSYVSSQIENLTSGTSSSHSRIKREQLAQIMVPYPVSNEAKQYVSSVGTAIKEAFAKKYEADKVLRNQVICLEQLKEA